MPSPECSSGARAASTSSGSSSIATANTTSGEPQSGHAWPRPSYPHSPERVQAEHLKRAMVTPLGYWGDPLRRSGRRCGRRTERRRASARRRTSARRRDVRFLARLLPGACASQRVASHSPARRTPGSPQTSQVVAPRASARSTASSTRAAGRHRSLPADAQGAVLLADLSHPKRAAVRADKRADACARALQQVAPAVVDGGQARRSRRRADETEDVVVGLDECLRPIGQRTASVRSSYVRSGAADGWRDFQSSTTISAGSSPVQRMMPAETS